MRHVAILTMDSLEDFFAYDTMLDSPFLKKGWQTHHVSWRDEQVNWDAFDVVIVRSTWDYQQDCDRFVRCLEKIEASSAALENPLSLMLWNIDKNYLKDLASDGVPIVPTLWKPAYETGCLKEAFAHFNCDTLIAKPTISANADDTFRITAQQAESYETLLADVFHDRALMLQPFLPAVLSPGEISLFYFGDTYSHAILKTPKADDFRVQEEHGGQLTAIIPTEEMQRVAEKTLAALPAKTLYARVDLITSGNEWCVMEVELIEPSLYFNMDKHSAQRFVDVFCHKYS
ncbi:hypothetical protein DRW07_04110 [Alteromonas sediminis]|uniref:Prokaryotic glutathione synthetase ATP-binding domain-containing protein n=1 Tax=Alteromonas sediminis TaxID=2259342 RepID=A0A3N5YF59_9ALTE|nr:hypothetical protein [Alteromonas sediminis]RPJ68595.1 hypothetical protein DRW07_04110 [Alteromonas sediminis]